MKFESDNFEIKFLKEEFAKRVEKNQNYSLRAFAKSLEIHVGALSAILTGKRPLTIKTGRKLIEKLGLSPVEKQEILKRLSLRGLDNGFASEEQAQELIEIEQDKFRIISDWYHYAILQIVRIEGFNKVSPGRVDKWIANQLGIPEIEANLAIERLLKLKLLTKDSHGHLSRTDGRITIANKNVTSTALIKWQRQLREKAIQSLENDPIEVRRMNSITMAVDPSKLEKAQKLIEKFQDDMSRLLEGGKKEKVFQMEVSLYPLQKLEN